MCGYDVFIEAFVGGNGVTAFCGPLAHVDKPDDPFSDLHPPVLPSRGVPIVGVVAVRLVCARPSCVCVVTDSRGSSGYSAGQAATWAGH